MSGKGGGHINDTLKAAGIDATRATRIMVFPEDLILITDEAHPLYDPRVALDPDPDFLADIRENGVQKDILVRLLEDKKGNPTLEVVAGRQRTKSSLIVNAELVKAGEEPRKVPVLIKRNVELSTLVLMSISENWQRPESVMSKAVKVQKALEAGATKEAVRLALRCAPNTIDDLLAFLGLSKEVQKAIEDGKLPLGTIKTMASVPLAQQAQILTQVQASGATKTHEVKAAVAAVKTGSKVVLPEGKKALSRPKIEAWAAELVEYTKDNPDDESAKAALKTLSFVLGYKNSLRGMIEVKRCAEAAGIPTKDEPVDSKTDAKEMDTF